MRVTFSCSAPFEVSKAEMLDKLYDFITSLDTTLHHENIIIEQDENSVSARLFFVEKSMVFRCDNGVLHIFCDSTMTGPGYHASMVSMLDYLSVALGVSWDESSVEDVTGYWQHRDFKRLQKFMTDWLIDYAKSLIEAEDRQDPVRTNLIMPFAMLPSGKEYFVCHILGYMDKDFFNDIQSFDDPEYFSRSFFIWWNIELDAEFYLKTALAGIWCHINWLPPVLESEMLDITNVLLELEIAWQMDKTLQLPVPEWMELAKLTDDQELVNELTRRFPIEVNQPPSKGYRRHNIIHGLGAKKWLIKLPGKMHIVNDDDGSLIFWDHDERNIRLNVSSQRDQSGEPLPALDLLSEAMDGLSVTPYLLPGYINVPAFISHSELQENGKKTFNTTLFAAMPGSLAVISIYYARPDERKWALSICNTLAPDPADKSQ